MQSSPCKELIFPASDASGKHYINKQDQELVEKEFLPGGTFHPVRWSWQIMTYRRVIKKNKTTAAGKFHTSPQWPGKLILSLLHCSTSAACQRLADRC